MDVIIIENKRAPVIAQMIWYNFGSEQRKGKSGLAHFMEHLMFKEPENFLIIITLTIFLRLAEVRMLSLVMIILLIIKYFQSQN